MSTSAAVPDAQSAVITPDTPIDQLPEFLTPREVFAYLRIRRTAGYAALRSGALPSIRVSGRLLRIPRAALQKYASAAARVA